MPDNQRILDYWNQEAVESMYDKNLLYAEVELIKKHIAPGSKILDVGCGEGEGTLVYASIPGVRAHAVDFSETRLEKARERMKACNNVSFRKVDLLGDYELDKDYDAIVSQRCLINLMEWRLQSKVLLDLMAMLKPGGRLLLLEGSRQGVERLNELRAALGLDPIPVKWHNLFFDDDVLAKFMEDNGYSLAGVEGLGTYFMLTRGIRPKLDNNLDWNCEFNQLAATPRLRNLLGHDTEFSRLKLWVFRK